MIKIGKDNYEEYALDYIEGNLSYAQREEFGRFLETDKEAQDEISFLMSDMPLLTPDENLYPGKKSLLRQTSLRRAIPYFGGAVAASVLLCLFLWISPSENIDEEEQTDNMAVFVSKKEPHTDIESVAGKSDFAKLPAETDTATKLPADNNAKKKSAPRISGVPVPAIHENETEIPTEKREYYEAHILAENVITSDMADDLEIEMYNEQKEISIPARLVVSQGSELLEAAALSDGRQASDSFFIKGLSALLMPVEQVIPVNRFQAGNSRGIEIASLIRITKKTPK